MAILKKGPCDGVRIEGLERLPERIVLEFDCVRHQANLSLFPDGINCHGAESIAAEYDYDDETGDYTCFFAGKAGL